MIPGIGPGCAPGPMLGWFRIMPPLSPDGKSYGISLFRYSMLNFAFSSADRALEKSSKER